MKEKQENPLNVRFSFAGEAKGKMTFSSILALVGECFGMAPYFAVALLAKRLCEGTAAVCMYQWGSCWKLLRHVQNPSGGQRGTAGGHHRPYGAEVYIELVCTAAEYCAGVRPELADGAGFKALLPSPLLGALPTSCPLSRKRTKLSSSTRDASSSRAPMKR